jgi:hypothetical protein
MLDAERLERGPGSTRQGDDGQGQGEAFHPVLLGVRARGYLNGMNKRVSNLGPSFPLLAFGGVLDIAEVPLFRSEFRSIPNDSA